MNAFINSISTKATLRMGMIIGKCSMHQVHYLTTSRALATLIQPCFQTRLTKQMRFCSRTIRTRCLNHIIPLWVLFSEIKETYLTRSSCINRLLRAVDQVPDDGWWLSRGGGVGVDEDLAFAFSNDTGEYGTSAADGHGNDGHDSC